jgi:O-antigen ligase
MLNAILFIFINTAGYLLTFTHNPVIAFVLYEAIYFFHPQNRWWGDMIPELSYSLLSVIIMLIALLKNNNSIYRNQIFKTPQLVFAYLIGLLYSIAYFYAVSPIAHYDATIYFLKLLIIITLAFKLINTALNLKYAIWGYMFGAWYISFYIYQIGRNAGDRVEGIGTVDAPEANGIAAAIAPALVFCLHYFLDSEKIKNRFLFAIAGIFIANALVLINSRGAFLAGAISVTYYMYFLYFSRTKRNHQKKIALILTLVGLIGSSLIVDDGFKNRMWSITDNTSVDITKESGSTRTIFWFAAWEMAKDHPFGSGFKGFNYNAPFYISEDVNTGNKRTRSVHSTWFETLSEIGYLGLFFLLLMIFYCFKTLSKCKNILRKNGDAKTLFFLIAIEAALISFIVSMTFIDRMRAEILYWCVLYTAAAYNIFYLQQKKTANNQEL